MSDAPKVFISHASEDKADYAEPLAKALRAKGVDAWLDKWEIKPGDSLVERIFEEGLADAGTCVYLMSPNSVDKDWVRAEFENAVAQRIAKKIRLIPVKLADCNIPNAVNSILWIDLARAGSIEKVADDIAKVVHEHSDKPELGPKPLYFDLATLHIPGLDKQDEAVLGIAFEVALQLGTRFLQTGNLLGPAEAKGIDSESLHDSLEMLCDDNYFELKSKTRGGRHMVVNMYATTFVNIARALDLPVEECERQLAGLILNEDIGSIEVIHDRMAAYPRVLVDALLDDFKVRGFINVARAMGGGGSVNTPSVQFKRWFRDVSA